MSKLSEYLSQKGLKIDKAMVANRQGVIDYLKQSRIDNKAYLDIPSPTASDRNAQVAKLTRQNIRIARFLINDMTGVD